MSLLPGAVALLRARGTPFAVIGAAPILLQLYAGGPQDAWDIDQLLGDA